jgi:hypothetical protein
MSADVLLLAPDIYYAAAVIVKEGISIGKGDRNQIIYAIKKQAKKCLAISEKLKLIQMGTFMGVKLFKDKFKKVPAKIDIGHKNRYQLWFTLVRQLKVMTNEEFKEAFP